MSNDTSFDEVAKWGAIIVGLVMAVPLTAILAVEAPMALMALIVVGFLAWAGIRSGILATDEADAEAATDADPLTTLQERYAAGDLSEAAFERRLDRILASDEAVRRAAEAAPTRDRTSRERREREPATERE